MGIKHSGALRTVAGRLRSEQSGISIIEVLVAALIFMIISIGIAQSMVTSIRFSGDQRHRVTALSLAAGEIDAARAEPDPFKLDDDEHTVAIDGITYTVTRDTSWVSGSGTDVPCGGSGTANLSLKRVNVTVEWTGQLASTLSVASDTVIAPDGRINDPAKGTIMVSVKGADGSARDAVSVGIAPGSTPNGAVALTTQPPATDSEGCSYALQVKPGNYRVTLTKANYVGLYLDASNNLAQGANPYKDVPVVAGASVSASFEFDKAATFNVTYAPGAPAGTIYPTDIVTSYFNQVGVFAVSARPAVVSMYPYPYGYTPLSGKYVQPTAATEGCRNPDPAEWLAGTSNGVALGRGSHGEPVTADPGGAASIVVPMGFVTVKLPNPSANATLTAVPIAQAAGTGDPGCTPTTPGTVYSFGTLTRNTTVKIALPFGSWRLKYGTNNITSNVTPTSNVAPNLVSNGIVTLDPRPAA